MLSAPAERHVELQFRAHIDPVEAGRRDTDDREGTIREPERGVDDVSPRTELGPPEAVTDDDGFRAATHIIGAREEAAHPGMHAECREEVPVHVAADDEPGFSAVGQVELREAGRREAGEAGGVVTRGFPERVGEERVALRRDRSSVVDAELDELRRPFDGERFEHHRVDEAEDGRIRPDADGEREDRHRREDGTRPQPAKRVANVRACRLEPHCTACGASLLLQPGDIAEFAPRRRRGRSVRHAA